VELLSNEALIHCHRDAIKLGLDQAFIDMLVSEMKKRNLENSYSIFSVNSCTFGA
jgi:hypothetical protein